MIDLENIKNKIGQNSGFVNMIINLLILFWLISVGAGVKDINTKLDQITKEPNTNEEVLKAQVIEMLIQKLNEAKWLN